MHDRSEMSVAVESALDCLRQVDGVDYADARAVQDRSEQLVLRNRSVDRLQTTSSAGVGVRVLYRGAWGFAGEPTHTPAAAEQAARSALAIARGVAAASSPRIRLAEQEPQRGSYTTPMAVDPFKVPTERRIEDLTAALELLRGREHASIREVSACMRWDQSHSYLATSEGTRVDQTLLYGGAGLQLTAARDDVLIHRSWPMDGDGGLRAAGYETMAALALADNAAQVRDEALALLAAPVCPSRRTALVLDTPQLALQIHESCGHPTEADRALGEEVSLAGASFLTPDKLGRFSYGASCVNLTADATQPGGLGTFGWDAEGVPARTTPLVARGQFVGYLSSRETAEHLGLGRSTGCMRASSWNRPAIIRIPNVSLEPDARGPSSLEQLLADTDDGILMDRTRSWSIDDLRLNFHFGCEAAWEIKRGKRTRLLRAPIYAGTTPAFWRSCDAIGNRDAWRLWGFATCGKGDPMQDAAVGHGCAPARFRNVEVGSSQ